MIAGSAVMTILRFLELLPAAFVALTEKLNVPVAVGVPEIVPVDVLIFKPVGSLPLAIDHVIGAVPVAARV